MDIEDGEIMESEELLKAAEDSFELEAYNRIERPVAPRPPAQMTRVVISDEDCSDDNGHASGSSVRSGTGKRRRQRAFASTTTATDLDISGGHTAVFAAAAQQVQARRACLSMRTSVLPEDGITDDMAGGLGHTVSGPRLERDVESHQLPKTRPRREPPPSEGELQRNQRKSGFQKAQLGWKRKHKKVVLLKELVVKEASPVEQVAADITLKLREEKA